MATQMATENSPAGTRETYILTASCRAATGVVAAVTSYLADRGCYICSLEQFDDESTAKFFMRAVFRPEQDSPDINVIREGFLPVAEKLGMEWAMRSANQPTKTLIMVSKFDHCLADLLYRQRIGELNMDVVAVVSNHPREALSIPLVENMPYHHLPVEKGKKDEQEAKVRALIEETGAELIVLARYMQILSDEMAAFLSGRCINIHHSFLPGFKGAKPYHQAHARGVKMIGATAHYVTADLDEGPIIAQDVEHISHADTPEELVAKGRDIECRVLAAAVRDHLQDRVLLNGSKTVVFRS